MNRTIKFRIWFQKEKRWLHGPDELPSLDGINLFGETILLGGFLDGISIEYLNELEALQFTGLEDKNNKGIFEGDILILDEEYEGREPLSPTTKGKSRPMEVYWDSDLSSFRLKYTDRFGLHTECLPRQSYSRLECEVVGNIFENPKMLNSDE